MSSSRIGSFVLAAGLVGSSLLAAPVAASPTPGAAPTTRAAGSTGRIVTVRGRIEHVAGDGVHGLVPTRTVLTSGRRHLYLLGLHRSLRSGDVVRATGSLRGTRLAVTGVSVLRAARPTSLRRAAHGTTKTLVVPVYWTAHAPAKPTRSQLKKQIVDYSRAWFTRVSGGRYTIKGTVAHWLRISRPAVCTDFYPVANNVYSHLRQHGINPRHYGRIIIYLPCGDGFLAGQASEPGSTVELYAYSTPQVVTHEQGHNLGLDHAASLTCAKSGKATVRDGHCTYTEYGDDTDTMGATYEGFYSAQRRAALGWLHGLATVGGSTTKTLVPYESEGHGLHAIKLNAGHGATYWMEYRTQASYDRGLTVGDVGLQIRVPGPGLHTRQLDLLPLKSSGFGPGTRDGTALALDGSWQTPEGVRITVKKMTTKGLTVGIDFHPGKKGAPDAPRGVQLTPALDSIKVAWTPPASSHGAPITAYRITEAASGKTRVLRASEKPQVTVGSLKPTKTYRFTVSAGNEFGFGPAFTSAVAQPLSGPPTASISAPKTAFGTVTFNADGSPNQDSGAPITSIQVQVDGQPAGTKLPDSQYAVDTTALSAGPHTFSVVVTDSLGNTATDSQAVTVNRVTLQVTSPTPGQTVGDDSSTFAYTLGNAAQVSFVELDLDGQYFATQDDPVVEGPNSIPVFYSGYADGPHTLTLNATSADGNSVASVSVPVTVQNTTF